MLVAAIIFSAFYFLLVMSYLHGWRKIKKQNVMSAVPATKISIIVPARNEEKNMVFTLIELANQNYPKELFEIIVVDDNSEDSTLQRALNFRDHYPGKDTNLKILQAGTAGGKKQAISRGIEEAWGDWIVLTDADCRRGKNWLKALAAEMEKRENVFISAPVCFTNEKTNFQKMQSLEFLSLIGIGAASIANQNPNMCNGANLAFRKDIFSEVGGYSGNMELASGDDEFLLHKIFKVHPSGVKFLKSREAVVYTVPFRQLGDFMRQRRRWVSKSRKYQRRQVTITLYFVYLFHLFILLSGILSLFSVQFLPAFILLLFTKLFAEFIFIIPVSRFFQRQKLLPWYFPAALAYIIYVVMIGIIGNSGSYEWKGRKVR